MSFYEMLLAKAIGSGSGGSGASDNVFIAYLTYDPGTGEYSCDKTHQEIVDQISFGKTVFFVNSIYHTIFVVSSVVYGSETYIDACNFKTEFDKDTGIFSRVTISALHYYNTDKISVSSTVLLENLQ